MSGTPEAVASEYTRMFIEEAKKSQTGQAKKKNVRWGTKTMVYTDAKVTVNEAEIVLDVQVEAKRAANHANLGFSIKDSADQTILGTNSQIKKVKIKDLAPGAKVTLRWTFPNIFRDDEYTLDLAAMDKDGEVWDWWEGVKTFKIFKEEKTPFKINTQTDLEVRITE